MEYKTVRTLDHTSDQWRELTGRISWIFWLNDYRLNRVKNKEYDLHEEAKLWEIEGPEYRATVRSALRNLDVEGIKFFKDEPL